VRDMDFRHAIADVRREHGEDAAMVIVVRGADGPMEGLTFVEAPRGSGIAKFRDVTGLTFWIDTQDIVALGGEKSA
jgi:hypothetical protein